MEVQTNKVIYVMRVPDDLMDKIRNETESWADGNQNICLMYEDALEIEEIRPLIENIKDAGDVIFSCFGD
jgi:hypothetical protein